METPPMQPSTNADELSYDEVSEAAELLTHFTSCVGHVPEVVIALLKTIIARRGDSSHLVLDMLRSCCGEPDESAA